MSVTTITESDGGIMLKKDDQLFQGSMEDFMGFEPSYPQGSHSQRIYRNQDGVGAHTLILENGQTIGQPFPWLVGEAYADKIPEYKEKQAKLLAKRQAAIFAKAKEEYEASLTYAEKRAQAYPGIGDQLDVIWKQLEAKGELNDESKKMLAKVKKVKADIPKDA